MTSSDDAQPTQPSGTPELIAKIAAGIRAGGPIPFARFMDLALYDDDHGYYRDPHRKPGRGGDFITSPELHPFFGFTLARQVVDCWERLGQPEHLVVREHGASSGVLAYDIIAALSAKAPEVREALDYRLIDVNEHRAAESLAAMRDSGLGEIVRIEHPDDLAPEAGIVIANEVADALPVHRLVLRDGALRELWVDIDDAGHFIDREADPSPEVVAMDLDAYLPAAGVDLDAFPEGARLDVSPATGEWIRGVADSLARGYAIVIDYGYDAATLYREHRLEGTVRGYHQHTVTDDPFVRVGQQDLTAHVDFTWLARAARDAGMVEVGLTTQSEFLTQLGLGEWLVEMQHDPETAIEEYYLAQGATYRLIDPAGLGRFRVLGLAKGMGEEPELLGFTRVSMPEPDPGMMRDDRTVRFG